MALPTDGYTPDQVVYTVNPTLPIIIDCLTLTVDLTTVGQLTLEQVDDLVRQHMQALFRALLAESGETEMVLLRSYEGTRDDDVSPEVSAPEGRA